MKCTTSFFFQNRPAAGLQRTGMFHAFVKAPWGAASLLAAVALTACGGGGGGAGGSVAPPADAAVTVSGKVIDGYLQGVIVCLDGNSNGRCDAGEPRSGPTDAKGAYSLQATKEQLQNGYALAVTNSKVLDAGVPLEARPAFVLRAPVSMAVQTETGYTLNLTPFTTLVAARTAAFKGSLKDATETVATAAGVSIEVANGDDFVARPVAGIAPFATLLANALGVAEEQVSKQTLDASSNPHVVQTATGLVVQEGLSTLKTAAAAGQTTPDQAKSALSPAFTIQALNAAIISAGGKPVSVPPAGTPSDPVPPAPPFTSQKVCLSTGSGGACTSSVSFSLKSSKLVVNEPFFVRVDWEGMEKSVKDYPTLDLVAAGGALQQCSIENHIPFHRERARYRCLASATGTYALRTSDTIREKQTTLGTVEIGLQPLCVAPNKLSEDGTHCVAPMAPTLPISSTGTDALNCYKEGALAATASCSSPEALALSGPGKQDGMRRMQNRMEFVKVAGFGVDQCMQDKLTGLVWDGTPAGGDWRADHQWYLRDVDIPAVTQRYVEEANARQLCGRSDWRLPTTSEGYSAQLFPSTVDGDPSDYINALFPGITTVFQHNGLSPRIFEHSVANPWDARPGDGLGVVAGVGSRVSDRFVRDNADGSELLDRATGLVWARCNVGRTWNQAQHKCDGTDQFFSVLDAFAYARDKGDWRLPSIKEAVTLIDDENRETTAWNSDVHECLTSYITGSCTFLTSTPVLVGYGISAETYPAGHSVYSADMLSDKPVINKTSLKFSTSTGEVRLVRPAR